MSVPAADNLRSIVMIFRKDMPAVNDAADLLDAVAKMHFPISYDLHDGFGEYKACAECAPTRWPCPTWRRLHPEGKRTG